MKTTTEGKLVIIHRSEIKAGDDIENAIRKAVALSNDSKFWDESVGFMFNGVPVVLTCTDIYNINGGFEEDKSDGEVALKEFIQKYNDQLSLIHPFPVDKFD